MDDTTDQSTDRSLRSEGSITLTEEQIRQMGNAPEIDYPMPGETVEEEDKHSHVMPDNVEFVDEAGTQV